MCGSNPLRSTLNTNVITGLDMCKVCTAIDRMIFAKKGSKKGCCPEWPRCVPILRICGVPI